MDSVQRSLGVSAVKPIIYGNSAERLKTSTPDGHTHRWRLFVRPYFHEDISKYIRKVQFRLHESYTNQVTAPYYMRLFQPVVTTPDGRQIVLYEHYDEIPTKVMIAALEAATRDKVIKSATDFHQQKTVLLDKLATAVKDINSEINELRETLKQNYLQGDASKPAESSRCTSVDGSVDSSMEH